MIIFVCPDCGKKFKVEDKAAGRQAVCPDCGKRIRVPTPKSEAPPPVPKESQPEVREQPPAPIKRRKAVSTEVIQPAPVSAVQVNVAQPSKAAHSLGIASVILGILAFLICWIPLVGLLGIPLSGLGLLLGIVGLVLAAIRRGHGIGFPIAGTAISLLVITITVSMTGAIWATATAVETAAAAVGKATEQALEEAAQELDEQIASEVTNDPKSDMPEFEEVQAKPVPINNPNFRNVKWGMSEAEVKAQEQAELVLEEENLVGYEDQIADLDCYIAYIFAQDTLVRATYMINEPHTNENDHISDYAGLKDLLTQKYGPPTKSEIVWKNSLSSSK